VSSMRLKVSLFSAVFAVSMTGCAQLHPDGKVTSTNNPQVALYTIKAPENATVSVEFGTDKHYGLQTSLQPAPAGGGDVPVFVAGMRANTLYHLRGTVYLSDGSKFVDADQTFITGALSTAQLPDMSASTTQGMNPQPGVELVNLLTVNTPVPVFASDLAGNVIWSYQFPSAVQNLIQSIKLLPNGHFLMAISPGSTAPLSPLALPAGSVDVIREIDLAGTTIRELSTSDLNTKLAAAGFNLTIGIFHHDVLQLPNGHWIVLTNTVQQFTDLPGFPGVTAVLGDVLVDVDQNSNPVWVWNEFDHFDVNHHPLLFPDWTHTNAVIYSADDGDLLVSLRHQNWVVKVDYRDGVGSGNVLWRLGAQGDFTLHGGVDPTDWFYAQHSPSFVSSNTAGKFSLVLFDNGNGRNFPNNATCQPTDASTCPYSTVPILDVDESAKTATLSFHFITPEFSTFGGNADVLQNGDVEFDECNSTDFAHPAADIYEVTQTSSPQTVWHMHIGGQSAYRAFRIPSLYPGVNW
jgi:arylsulfate sulfotransferase